MRMRFGDPSDARRAGISAGGAGPPQAKIENASALAPAARNRRRRTESGERMESLLDLPLDDLVVGGAFLQAREECAGLARASRVAVGEREV